MEAEFDTTLRTRRQLCACRRYASGQAVMDWLWVIALQVSVAGGRCVRATLRTCCPVGSPSFPCGLDTHALAAS